MQEYDVVVIGGGVIGCSVARFLSKYELKTCVLEKEEDVCSGTSKANSAIVHAGFDAKPNSLKAKFNVKGNRMMGELARELDFEYRQNGSLVICLEGQSKEGLESLLQKGIENGVEGLEIISGEQAREMEPNLSEQVTWALWAPSGGIVCPFGLTIALAENAAVNGVEFRRGEAVKNIKREGNHYRIETEKEEISADFIVNAAGLYADTIHNMVSKEQISIRPRKGEYCLLDKSAGEVVSHTIFQLPGVYGKGVLVTPTVHGNLLLGPTAVDIDDKECTETTEEGIDLVITTASQGVKAIPMRQVITSFTGLRAHERSDDFLVGEVMDAPGFFDAAGIESPGLTAAPAIGEYLADQIAEKANAEKKNNFSSCRKGILKLADMTVEMRDKLIKERPEYGKIVCRCEQISEGEIIDAIHRPVGAVSMDGVKRRTRAGMGRCQAGFCTPHTLSILATERQVSPQDICKNRKGSIMVVGTIEEKREDGNDKL